jgi:hypothetical protein
MLLHIRKILRLLTVTLLPRALYLSGVQCIDVVNKTKLLWSVGLSVFHEKGWELKCPGSGNYCIVNRRDGLGVLICWRFKVNGNVIVVTATGMVYVVLWLTVANSSREILKWMIHWGVYAVAVQKRETEYRRGGFVIGRFAAIRLWAGSGISCTLPVTPAYFPQSAALVCC